MTTILCHDLIEFFQVKNELTARGMVYVRNQKVSESRGVNYIKVEDIGLFGLIGKLEYERINDEL